MFLFNLSYSFTAIIFIKNFICRFDILVLALTLMINLVENCKANRALLMKSRIPDGPDTFNSPSEREVSYAGLIQMFLDKEESARQEESKTSELTSYSA